jgi:hypothetical protein
MFAGRFPACFQDPLRKFAEGIVGPQSGPDVGIAF